MKTVELKTIPHGVKIGDQCGDIEPNIVEDSLFHFDGELVGFYLKNIADHSEKAAKLADVANSELLSDRVPKNSTKRSESAGGIVQHSTIIGGIPPKAHMRRPYPSMSSVHDSDTAKTFVKSMLLLCRESEEIIARLAPDIFHRQTKIIAESVDPKWRLGRMFTSSISNFNIAAAYHRDGGNIVGCVNVIIAKKNMARGGNTTVPDYGATVDSSDNSMLVYPAWRNVHGVTPIRILAEGGYRNSLVFYPLKAFASKKEPRG